MARLTRRQLHRAVARRTGEPLAVIRRLGFQLWTLVAPPPSRRRGSPKEQRRTAA